MSFGLVLSLKSLVYWLLPAFNEAVWMDNWCLELAVKKNGQTGVVYFYTVFLAHKIRGLSYKVLLLSGLHTSY